MKKIIILLMLATGFVQLVQAQVSKKFAKEAKVLIEAKEKEFQGKLIEENGESVTYETILKLTGFDVKYELSRDDIAIFATYLKKGDEKTMDAISKQLTTAPYLVQDSKDKPNLIGKGISDMDIIRKIKVRDHDTGNLLLTITLDKKGAIKCKFEK